MYKRRTDLAIEATEMLSKSGAELSSIQGISASQHQSRGFNISEVKVLNEDGAKAIDKPIGSYVTIELTKLLKREDNSFVNAVDTIADEISKMLPDDIKNGVLVAGLGNRYITADAVGPETINHVMVTRHLIEHMPEHFGDFAKTSAVAPGVLGLTGVETGEILKGVCEKTEPSAVIVIDALASGKISRLCTTVQISDTGIIPGSGIGNSRNAITKDVFGIPVIAVGVPTVVSADTIVADVSEQIGADDSFISKATSSHKDLIVTPKDIDKYISDTSKVIGYGINKALNHDISIEDMELFLS